jgi:hypothetical protein
MSHNVIIWNRNRLIEVSKNLLPIEEEDTSVGFNSLTRQQIEYMKANRTTQLPPWMFRKAVTTQKAANGAKEIIKELQFERFTLTTEFPQNCCVMKDGSIVFCDEFVPSGTSSSSSKVENRPPIIRGFKFLSVCLILQ